MIIRKEVLGKQVQFGGEEHRGWLPSNSSWPKPTPLENLVLDVRILEGDEGFILEWQSPNTDDGNDSWHATLEDAESQAKVCFGIERSEWRDSDRDI
ncbi:MAG TPA: hypothetical protein VJ124_23925 [Pyrinomonadaceae bacterium]|nr:hypothetical protein [Pyrinomonadaceae bacterium]